MEGVLGDSSHGAFYGDDKESLLPWEAQGWQGRSQAQEDWIQHGACCHIAQADDQVGTQGS